MNHLTRIGAAALGLAALATAQTITSSPAGYETTPGPSSGVRPFFGSGYRFQAVDHTHVGTPLSNIIALNFRRDEDAAAASGAVSRTADITVRMGHGDTQIFQTAWDDNYTAMPTTVFTTKPVNLPDLTAQTAGGGVEPWAIRLPFDVPFNYDGVQDIVYETIYQNATATTSYKLDRAPSTGSLYQVGFGSGIGTGCTVAGASGPFSLTSISYSHNGSQLMRIGFEASNAPASQPVVMNISGIQSNLTAPGLCGTIYATPDISAPLGTSDSTGSIGRGYYSFSFSPALVANPIYVQAAALDPTATGIPVALSQGASIQWPAAGAPASDFAFIYSSDPTGAEGAGPITFIGPIVAGLEQ